MLGVLISLVFGLAAFVALAVIRSSTIHGVLRARQIVAERATGARHAGRQINREVWRPAPARQLRFAAA